MNRYDLTDFEWRLIEPLLPQQTPSRAAYGIPNRKAPFAGKEIIVNKPYTKTDGVKAFVPTGFSYGLVWSR
jgi:transposase